MEEDDDYQQVDISNEIPDSNDFLSAEWDNPDEDEYSLISNELRETDHNNGGSPTTGIYEDDSTVEGGGWSALERYEDGLRGPSMLTMSEATELQSLHSQALNNNNKLKEELDQYKRRLKRRTELVGTMRMAYLKDVILLKNVITNELNDKERKNVMSNFEESLPSFDMRQPLALYAPKDTHMEFEPCETCGGTVEILLKDSKRLQKLEENVRKAKSTISHLLEEKAISDEKKNIVERHLMELESKRDMEKKLLYEEIKRCKVDTQKANTDKNASMNRMEVLNAKVIELEDVAKKAKAMEKELEEVHEQNNRRKSEIEHLQIQKRDMTDQIDEFERTLTTKEEEIDSKSTEIEEKDKQIEELTSKLQHTEHALAENRDVLHTTQQDLTANREKLAKVSEDKRQLSMAHMEEIEKVKESASGLQDLLQQAKNDATEKDMQILDQMVLIDKTRIEREVAMMTTEDKDHMILHLEDEIHHLESEVESLHIEHDVSAQEMEQMKSYIAELEAKGTGTGSAMSSRPVSRQLDDRSDYDFTPTNSRPQTRQTDDEGEESGIDNAEKEAEKQAKLAELAAEEAAVRAEKERQDQMVKDLEAQLRAMMKQHEAALGDALNAHQNALNEAINSKELEQKAALEAAEEEKQALLEKAELEKQASLKEETDKMEALLKQNEEAEKIAEQQRLELEEQLKKQLEEEAAARAALEGASEEAKAKMEAEAKEKHEKIEAQLAAAQAAAKSKREEQKAEKERLVQIEKEMKEAVEKAATAHAAAEAAAQEKVAAAEAAAKAAAEEAAKIASQANADADAKIAQAATESAQANDVASQQNEEMKAKVLADMAALKAQLQSAVDAKNAAAKKEETIKAQETLIIESKPSRNSRDSGRSRSKRESKRGGGSRSRSRKSRSSESNPDNDPSVLEVDKLEASAPAAAAAAAATAAPGKKKKEVKVDLIALKDGASPEEAMLYQEFLDACINGLGPGTGKKAMNALINSTILDRLAELLKNSCSRLLESFTTLRNIGDYIPKLIKILYVLTISKRCDDLIEAKKAELKKVTEEDPENHGKIKDIEEEIEQAELNPKVVQDEITQALNILRNSEDKQSLNWLERHGLSEALKTALAAADERQYAIALKTATDGTAAEENAPIDATTSSSTEGEKKGSDTDSAVVSVPDATTTTDEVVDNGQSSQDMIHHAYFTGNIVDINARVVESSGVIESTKAHLSSCQNKLEDDFKIALKEYLTAKTAQLEAPVLQRRAVKAIETKANKQVKVAEKATNKEKSKVEMLKSDVSRYTSTIEELSTQVSEMQAIELDRDRWKEKTEGLEEVKAALEEEKLGFQQEIRDLNRSSSRLEERLQEATQELVGNKEEVKASRLQMKMNNDRMDLAVQKQSKAERELQMNLDAAQAAKDRLRENSAQCSVDMADMSTGTEFICPPQMSLRYTASTLGLNTNRKQFPIAMPITNRANKLRYVYNKEDPTVGSGPLKVPKPSLFPERPSINIRTVTPSFTDDVEADDDNSYHQDVYPDAPDDSTYNLSTLDSHGGGDLDAPASFSLDSTTNMTDSTNNIKKLGRTVELNNEINGNGNDARPQTTGTNATKDTSTSQDTETNTIHYTSIQHPSDGDKTTSDVRDKSISINIPLSTPPPSAKKPMDDQLTHTSNVAGSIMSILARKEVPRLSASRVLLEPEKQNVGRSVKGKKYIDRRKDRMKSATTNTNTNTINNNKTSKNSSKNMVTIVGTGGASGTQRLISGQLEGLTLRNYLVDNRGNDEDPYYDMGGDGWSQGMRTSFESAIDAYSSVDTTSKIEFGIPQVANVSNQVEMEVGESQEDFDDVYEDPPSPDHAGVSAMAINTSKRVMMGSRDSQTVHLESPKNNIHVRDGF